MNVFKRLLMLSGGGTSVPYDYPDKFAFFADQAIVEPSILEVLRPSDRLGDFTVSRGSNATYVDSDGIIKEAIYLGDDIVQSSTIVNQGGGIMSFIEGGINSLSDGTSTSELRPKIEFSTAEVGKSYQVDIIPTINSGDTLMSFYDGASYIFQYSIIEPKSFIYTCINTNNNFATNGINTFNIDFEISVKEISYDIARIDYTNGVAELLTEPQSTNLCVWSSEMSNLTWVKSNMTVTPNATISPDGTQNADLLQGQYIYQGITVIPNTDYNYSFYVKNNNTSAARVAVYDVTNAIFLVNQVSYLDEINNNTWVRIEASFTTGATTTEIRVYPTRDVGSSIYCWGSMVEALPYATSYIPTNGSTVTRLQDSITDGGNVNVINSEEGVLFFDGSALFDDTGENRYLSLSDGTENNVINISYNTNGALIQFLINAGGALILSHAQPAVDITTNAKVAVKWKVNDFAIWINGAEVDTVLSGVVPTGLNSVNLSNAIGANYFNSRTKAIKVYDRALDNEELEQITTL